VTLKANGAPSFKAFGFFQTDEKKHHSPSHVICPLAHGKEALFSFIFFLVNVS